MTTSDRAELSSLGNLLADVEARLAAVARHWDGVDRDDVLSALHDAERSVRSARRACELARTRIG